MKKYFLLLIFLLSFSLLFSVPRCARTNQAFAENYYELTRADSAHGFDVTHYDISMQIDNANDFISGTVIAQIVAEETLSEIIFELEQMTVNNVLLNNSNADFTYDDHEITIQLQNINAGDVFSLIVDYEGNPLWDGLGMFFSNYHVFTISDPNASRYWWPCYDHPWDKAVTDLHITVREDWEVASNGILTDVVNNGNGTRTHHWEGGNPMATYLVSLVCQELVELNDNFGDIPIQNFVPPGMVSNATEDFSNLPFMMQVYSDLYGDYPFEKYGNAVTSFATYAAMEHQTMTTLNNSLITGNHTYETIIAHELSHQWFGDCLTALTWKDIWLSEGFATYSEALYTEHWQDYQAMLDYTRISIQNYYKNWAGNTPYVVYDPPAGAFFTPATYEKPASVLHMLRRIVGNDTFFEILQTYFNKFHNGNVITDDFVAVCDSLTQNDYLQTFFEDWIFKSGTPKFEFSWLIKNDPVNPELMTFVKSNSNGTAEFIGLPVPLQINYETYYDSVLVSSAPSGSEMQSIIPLADINFESLEFDPDSWVLSRGSTHKNVQINNAYAADEMVVVYWNEFLPEIGVDGYDIYRSDQPNDDFVKINSELITENSYWDENVQNGTTYYYKIKAVIDEFSTMFSEIYQATPLEFPLDQGILVVDETVDGPGTQGNPDDAMVDQFYQNVLNTDFTAWDYNDEGAPGLDNLRHYSIVIWHDDDLNQPLLEDDLDDLGCYLVSGGNLIISGWKTANEIPDDFKSDFLDIGQTQLVSEWEFTNASSSDYSALSLDPDKLNPAFGGTLPYVCLFPDANNGFYQFDGIAGSSYIGEDCAVKSEPEGTFALFGFPLYFFLENDVTLFFDQILAEIGGSKVTQLIIPKANKLFQNFPNPFNPSTTISFSLTTENTESTEIIIYNLKGQNIRTLPVTLSGVEELKMTKTWNGRDENNKPVSSGVYFYQLQVDGKLVASRKMLLVK